MLTEGEQKCTDALAELSEEWTTQGHSADLLYTAIKYIEVRAAMRHNMKIFMKKREK